ncbi:Ras guanine nucleotide exchange factor bud5, partial [Coemansia sp. RSA 2607]
MAFYFNQGTRREKTHEKPALGPSPLKNDSAKPQSTASEATPKQLPVQRRRERLGETLRLTRPGAAALRDIRLAKIFGEPVLAPQDSSDAYSTRDILFNSSGRVSYGTWHGLVTYLTQANQQDDYTAAFFLTFRSFATPADLAHALVRRAQIVPLGLATEDLKLWRHRVLPPIRHRVFLAIRTWYTRYWQPYTDNEQLPILCRFLLNEYLPGRHGSAARDCARFLQMVEDKSGVELQAMRESAAASSLTPSRQLVVQPVDGESLEETSHVNAQSKSTPQANHDHRKGILRRMFGRSSQELRDTPPADSQSPSDDPDITDLLMATVGMDLSIEAYRRISHILNINPVDVACQLTIIESSCYCQIQPYELLNKEFSRRPLSSAHNVRQMSRWSTQISRWASMLILSEVTAERRCRLLKYFINLGIQLLALKNYDAVMAIKGAIYCAGVMRLKRTWSLLPKKFTIMCRRLLDAMDSDHNYANYRELLRKSQPPLLPFLGLYLTDLTFLEDGNPTYR